MTALLLACSILAQAPAEGPAAFAARFADRRADSPVESPDPAIAACMESLIFAIHRESDGLTPGRLDQILRPYRQAVRGQGTVRNTDYRTIGATFATAPQRIAVNVRMGAASRLALFDRATGRRLALPAEFDWLFQHTARPTFGAGGVIVLDCRLIHDGADRAGYRVVWLSPVAGGYERSGGFAGTWVTRGESPAVVVEGSRVTARTIDAPRTFVVPDSLPLFPRTIVWETRSARPVRERETEGRPALRRLDAWIAATLVARDPTPDQIRFLAEFQEMATARRIAERTLENGEVEVTLQFDRTFVFRLAPRTFDVLSLRVSA